ncbi:hypothetical protein Pla123a_30280 [Posidoniimonas polymericola]|uniref:Uncharacterized protein n=1 Tax=Posidoniimonas polymericola TaxID=2528002 RepID=A0A5C5YL45_9BACT|nr:hypothetical protein [Posidoniimonas polymericola]TWT75519.1 hypothetical protein Pla123a_30280 [Posidoniimonas polymericola]
MLSPERVKQIETLLASGMPRRRVSRLTGVRTGIIAKIEAGERPRGRRGVATVDTWERVRAAAEHYRRQHRGRAPERPRVARDPADAYLPSAEEIEAHCERFRAQHLAELV